MSNSLAAATAWMGGVYFWTEVSCRCWLLTLCRFKTKQKDVQKMYAQKVSRLQRQKLCVGAIRRWWQHFGERGEVTGVRAVTGRTHWHWPSPLRPWPCLEAVWDILFSPEILTSMCCVMLSNHSLLQYCCVSVLTVCFWVLRAMVTNTSLCTTSGRSWISATKIFVHPSARQPMRSASTCWPRRPPRLSTSVSLVHCDWLIWSPKCGSLWLVDLVP